ncbi:MAG: amino acid ABC transporter permease [Clostridia bacterium]|nr:amino acid ABC transporter permease [Clostridia bacterium]
MSTMVKLLTIYRPMFFDGLRVTLLLSLFAIVASTLIGSVICVIRMWGIAPLRWLCAAYIEVIRGTPILLQLYFFVFLLPRVIPLNLTNLQAVMLSLALCAAAYVSELMRVGIQAVDKGQTEAARSVGLSGFQTLRYIVLPQAVKNILPALGNEFILIIKDTSLASIFFIGDLMTVQKTLTSSLYLSLEPMTLVAAIYFTMTFTLSKLIQLYESRVKVD